MVERGEMVDMGLLDGIGRGKNKKYIRKNTPNNQGF